MLAHGDDAGSIIDEVKANGENLVSIVHRAAFLRELLDDVPPERLHASKKLIEIERSNEDSPAVLHFTDGTTTRV